MPLPRHSYHTPHIVNVLAMHVTCSLVHCKWCKQVGISELEENFMRGFSSAFIAKPSCKAEALRHSSLRTMRLFLGACQQRDTPPKAGAQS